MPSTAVQSRISAFESIAGNTSVSPSFPPSSTARRAQINGRMLETPLSPPLTPRQSLSTSPSPSPPNLGRKTSLIDLKDWVVDDGPSPTRTNNIKQFSHTASGNGRTPTQMGFEAKKQLIAPLINFESPPKTKTKPPPPLTTKAPPLPPRKPSYTSLRSAASQTSLASNNGERRSDSLTVDRIHTYPPLKIDPDSRFRNSSGHAPASSISSFHSVSLSSDTDPSTPGSVSNFISTFPMDRDHDHEQKYSRTSNGSEVDSISLGESYEEVSTTALASPTTERIISSDWEKAMAKRNPMPPKLPQRPSSTASSSKAAIKSPPPRPRSSPSTPGSPIVRASLSSVSSSSTIPTVPPGRRAPPPPPTSRSSDRSSIQSIATSNSSHSNSNHGHNDRQYNNLRDAKTKRPTPVPAAVRVRYEAVFNANVVQQRKAEKQKTNEKPALLSPMEAKRTRQAAGWRGLSVDLITGGEDTPVPVTSREEDEEVDSIVGPNDRLEGHVVKAIWRRSRLDQHRLADIWNECDPSSTGSLNRDSFVKGMWRIDEELRRAHTKALKSASSASLAALRAKGVFKPPVPPVPKSKPILR